MVEVRPCPLVHLAWIEIGAKHRAHTHAVALGSGPVCLGGVGRAPQGLQGGGVTRNAAAKTQVNAAGMERGRCNTQM